LLASVVVSSTKYRQIKYSRERGREKKSCLSTHMERGKCHCHGLLKRTWFQLSSNDRPQRKNYLSESADGFPNGSLVNTTGPRWSSEDKVIIRVHHFQAYFQAYIAEGRCHFHVDKHGSYKNVQALQFYTKKEQH
jgi:hypothetical protein